MKKVLGIGLLVLLLMAATYAAWLYSQQQIADPDYEPQIVAANWSGERPVVAIDGGHENFHRLDGRFAPFGLLARHGGFDVVSMDGEIGDKPITARILVVANASATLKEDEIDRIVSWVEGGGSLLLIADHAPFGSFAAPLASRFGVEMGNGFVLTGPRDKLQGKITFTDDQLGDHPILSGDGNSRDIAQVRSFTGQSLTVPEGASVLLALPAGAAEFADRAAAQAFIDGGDAGLDVGGRAQAIALEHGEGRVVISGEAAMFTSQTQRGNRDRTMGVQEVDNEAYVLNVLDWLAGRTG